MVQQTNALGHVTSTTWDTVCGVVSAVTNANGQTSSTSYDALCRPVRATGPKGSFVATIYANPGDPNRHYVETDTPSADGKGDQWTRTYLDGMGRPWQTVSKGPNGREIFTTTAYDPRGSAWHVSAPFFAKDRPDVTTTLRDTLNRPFAVQFPDGTITWTEHDLWTTTTVDELGHRQTSVADAYGHVVKHVDYEKNAPVATTYEYDLRGFPMGVTDTVGNHWSYMVDSLGRRRQSIDPDTGKRTFRYDANGREISHTDALGQTTTATYDALGRILTKTVSRN